MLVAPDHPGYPGYPGCPGRYPRWVVPVEIVSIAVDDQMFVVVLVVSTMVVVVHRVLHLCKFQSLVLVSVSCNTTYPVQY